MNFNYGNIVFKSNGTYFLNNKLYLIYVYFMDNDSLRGINFSLELNSLIMIAIGMFGGAIGGILGVNLK